MNKKTIIISLGGSLIVPEEVDWKFLKQFKKAIETQIEKGFRFIIITGGGRTCRKYQAAAKKVTKLTSDDVDWIGIHTSRLNAHLIRTIFREHAHAIINKNPYDLESFLKAKESILVAAGYKPGNSTDYIAVLLAKQFGATKIANLSNIDYVCDKNPQKHPDAKKIKEINWADFQKIVGDTWDPGANVPFDPIASKLAAKEDIEVVILNGKKIANFEKYLNGQKFVGTTIK